MAETILPIAKKLAKQVPELLVKEIKFLYEVSKEVKSVEEKLEKMGSELKKADIMTDEEEEFHKWVSQLKDLAFKAEDVIEVFINNETPCDGCNILQLIMGCFRQIITLHKLKKEIDDINSKLAKLLEEKPEFKERSVEDGETSNDLREKGGPLSETKEDHIVGFEKEEGDLSSWLTENDPQQLGWRVIVSIWATGGAGKTSLAYKIYKNSSVTRQFDCVAWVSVSQKCDVKAIWQAIFEQIKDGLRKEEKEELQTVDVREKINACLKGKDYLIILDDIWKRQDFEDLIKAFPESSEKKCRILLTARESVVAGLATYRLDLRILNPEESMKLFLKKVYQSAPHKRESVPEDRKLLATRILSKCNGLPIAIVLLGGILQSGWDDTNEWRSLSTRVDSALVDTGDILKVLSLSYIALPYDLRPCFLYFSLFPEDSVVHCDKLIRLWLAEGFLEQQVVAEESLKGLIRRSLIQVVEFKSNGDPQTCCTHDLIRDLAIREAEKAQFSRISKDQPLASVEGIRRIALHPKDTHDIPASSSSVPNQSKALISLSDHPQSSLQSWRMIPPRVVEGDDDLVGFQEEVDEVAASLTSEQPLGRLAVVSIVGDAGIGKTAVARKVYNNVKSHFDYRAWVHIHTSGTATQPFLCTILEQVTTLQKADIKIKGKEELRCMFHKLLEEKSILIVLDDLLWQDHLDAIEMAFPKPLPNQKCRILCTIEEGRNIYFNTDISIMGCVELKKLNVDLCLKLFLKTVFKCSLDEIPKVSLSKEMKDIARKMVVEYCQEFPFAILPLGSLLSGKAIVLSVWKDVLQSFNQEVPAGAFKYAYEKVFLVCFLDLPDHLRSCIRYFNCLPMYRGVESNILIQQWAEQGLLKSGRDNKAIEEEVGRDCLRVLIQRNLLDVIKCGSNGEPQTCILISHFHYFLQFKLPYYESDKRSKNNRQRLEEASLLHAHDHPKGSEVQYGTSTPPPPHSQSRTFNLSHLLSSLNPSKFFRFPNHVYSLLCFSKKPQFGVEQFPLLRVVDLQGAEKMEEVPNEIRNLTLLRYFSLRGTRVKLIPTWIADLHNLQTLDAPTSKIPTEALKLLQLRYLFADSFYDPSSSSSSSSSTPCLCIDIGVLEHLHTLELDTADWIISGLDKLTNIRVLRLHGGDDNMFKAIASILASLKSLSLTHAKASSKVHLLFSNHSHVFRLEELILEGTKIGFPTPPKTIHFPLELTYLWLETYIHNDPFCILQQLRSLKKLCLRLFRDNSHIIMYTAMTCSKDRFPNLDYFYISVDFLINLDGPLDVRWTVEQRALRNLRVLHIEGDHLLGHLPVGLRHVTTLKELILTRGFDTRGELIRRSGRDWWEVANIPSLSIKYRDESHMKP